jgi:predicted dehydrogenase
MEHRAKIRFGLVGAGAISQAYAQALQNCASAEISGVADSRPEAANVLAELTGGRPYDSYRQMADQERPEAVIVCTPPDTHEGIATYFLNRGIPVLCEKPLSVNLTSALRMVKAAERNGVIFSMASKFRCVDDVVRAKSLLDSGSLGNMILLENVFASRVDMSTRWNSQPSVSGGGVLIDNGTHSLDLVRYFLGPLSEVQVVEGMRSQGLAVEETVCIFVRAMSGTMAKIDLSWSLQKHQESYLDAYGSTGTLSLGWKESKYRLTSQPNWTVFGTGYDKIKAFRRQVTNFCAAIHGEEPLLITVDDMIASMKVVEAAYASLELNSWVSIGARRGSLEPVMESGSPPAHRES